MTKQNKILLIASIFIVAVIYMTPLFFILFATEQRLPDRVAYQSSIIRAEELTSSGNGILLRASQFESRQLSNEPFPRIITATSPGSHPTVPSPRIRTAISDHKDWYSAIVTIIFFPIVVIAAGGAIIFGVFAIGIILVVCRKLFRRGKVAGLLACSSFLAVLIAITFLLAVWPFLLHEYYKQRRPLVPESLPMNYYIGGGSLRTSLVIANGVASAVDLYADGLWFDRVPPKAIRKYMQLRDFSRLTTISDRGVLDDFYISDGPDRKGFLIYNVRGADNIWIEYPPRYK